MAIFTLGLFYYGGVEKASAEEVTSSIGYVCKASALGQSFDLDMTIKPTMSVPSSVEADSSFSITNIDTDVEIDLSEAPSLLQGALNPFTANISAFYLHVNDSKENVLKDGGVDVNDVDAVDNIIPFNVKGTDTAFNVEKEEVEIKTGDVVAVIDTMVGGVNATCAPSGDNVIANVKVEEKDDGNEEDNVAPEITLNGDNPMELEVGDTYEEPGASAEDDVDGDVSDDIKITGEVNTDEAGTYEVVYTVSDEAGNEATVTREVIVVEEEEEDPLVEALNAVNNAKTAGEMRAALEDEELGLNLAAYNSRNTYQRNNIANHILENRPESGFKVGSVDSKDEEYDNSVQKALNTANLQLYILGNKGPEELAFEAVNEAESAEAMEAALENEDLEVDIAAYSELFGYEQAEVARLLLENRPDDEEGYPLPANIQEALDDAINIVTKAEEREELENQIKDLEKELEQLSKELENAQDEAAEVQEALKQAKEELENALAKAEQALEEAENATEAAAQAKKEAEEAREAAEQAKEDVEKARKDAEEAKQAAEKALAEAEQAKKDAAKALEEAQKALDKAKNNEENEDEENNENSNNDENNGNNDNNKNDDDKNGDKGDKKETTVTTVSNDKGNGNTGGKGLLPNTATNNPLYIALGAGLLLLGSATTLVARRKKLN